ncbi:S8 family serine peptidase [Patescibacteria group bacterium]|nr:S8 family serine peptidase [Patescibacteria group bacterium]
MFHFNKKLSAIIIVCLILTFFPLSSIKASPVNFHIAGLAVSDIGAQEQWYLDKIQAPDAWLETRGSGSIVVAVIDTGIDLDHPDLRSNIWKNPAEIPDNNIDDDNNGFIDDVHGWNFMDDNNNPQPNPQKKEHVKIAINHGTAVAGVIAAQGNNAFAGAGVAWQAKLMSLKVFNDQGDSDSFLVERAIQYAIDNGADIINMSFVGLGYASSLQAKIKAAYDAGILLVAAAGNDSTHENGASLDMVESFPVCHDGPSGENWILGVAAVDENDKRAEFSNYGHSCVDISAPGTNINSSLFHDNSDDDFHEYFGGNFKGTSVSAPQVVGAAILLKALHPNYTNKELMQVLIGSADNIDSLNPSYVGKLGSGRLNVLKAVQSKLISKETEEELKTKYALSSKAGDEPKVWLLDAKGDVLREFYAFAPAFKGGINLALGDIDNDGMTEIVAGAGFGGGPHVRIFNLSGELEYQFFAFDESNRNGVLVAVGDIDGDKKNEIIAVEAGKAKPTARIFDKNGVMIKDDIEIFENYFQNSISLSVGDVNRDGRAEIVAGAPIGARAQVKVIDTAGDILGNFSPFEYNFYGKVNIAIGDLNNDGWSEVITSKDSYSDSKIRTFTYEGRLLSPGFLAYENYGYGISLSSGDRNSDKEYEIITAPNGKHETEIKVWDKNLNLTASLFPFGKNVYKNVSAYIITR